MTERARFPTSIPIAALAILPGSPTTVIVCVIVSASKSVGATKQEHAIKATLTTLAIVTTIENCKETFLIGVTLILNSGKRDLGSLLWFIRRFQDGCKWCLISSMFLRLIDGARPQAIKCKVQ